MSLENPGARSPEPGAFPPCDCGEPVLDGHLTCGDVACGTQAEAEARRRQRPTLKVSTLSGPSIVTLRTATASRVSEGAAIFFRRECVFCGSYGHRTSECPETP